jgi:hypothetical protein
MAAAIRITYDALMMLCSDTVSGLPMDMSDGSHASEFETDGRYGATASLPRRALPAEDNMTALCVRNGQPFQYEHVETDPPVHFAALADGSLALTPVRQPNRIVGMLALAEVPPVSAPRRVSELEVSACEFPCTQEEEGTAAEPYAEELPCSTTEPEPDWSAAETPAASSPIATDHAPSEIAIQQLQQEERDNPSTIQSLATLRLPDWVQGSTSRFFGAFSLSILALVAILMATGGVLGIYLANPHRPTLKSAVAATASSAAQTEVGAVSLPAGGKTEFKFDPDPVVAALGSSFVLNAVLSRGTDIGSVGVQIDYDANLLQFMGVSEGGFLDKAGQNFVLAQRNDPVTGVVKINAEQPLGTPGISGDGAVFALSFQARRKGNATVSIIPGAHDSQGRRIEIAGSQVSVRVN